MDRQFRNRLFVVAALGVLLPVVIVLCKLGVMQIGDHDEYAKRAEATRARTELLFPTRSRITDVNGIVLADSESVWDLTLDVYELTHPRHVLARATASPEVYPPLAEIEAFHREQVLPALEADLPPPVRARRFMKLWQLRQHPLVQHDRGIVVAQVARLANVDPAQIEMRIDIVEREINAIVQGLSSSASQRQVQRAFTESMAASRDPEYWERIRRFPKSLALEPVLRHRIEGHRGLLQRLEATATALGKASDASAVLAQELRTAAESLSELEHHLSSFATAILPTVGVAEQDVAPTSPEAATAAEDVAIARRWLDALGMAAGSEDPVASLRREATRLDGTSGEIADLETRLGRLQEKLLRPHQAAWDTRWPSLLADISVLSRGVQLGEDGALGFSNPLLVAQRIDRGVVEALKTHRSLVGGVRCEARSVRRYPLGSTAQALVGHMRLPDGEALEERVIAASQWPVMEPLLNSWFDGNATLFGDAFRGTLARQPAGITGVEGYHELRLAGQPGARAVYVDARGLERSVEGEWQPEAAPDLKLTLDAGLMDFAAQTIRAWEPKLRERALGKNRETWDEVGNDAWALRGSLILIDVDTGAIICMLDIDDELTGRADREAAKSSSAAGNSGAAVAATVPPSWRWMDPASSLPRSVGGQYEPGSTFKILTSIAMLEEGVVNARSSFDDIYHEYRIGTEIAKSNHKAGYNINVVRALSKSSNGYYWNYSTKMGDGRANRGLTEVLLPWARRFGFGEKPGLDITGLQAAGRLPRPGRVDDPPELARNVMGQGAMTASPLQVARFIAAVAARGRLTTPHLSAESDGNAVTIPVSDETWRLVHQGMWECVNDVEGTAYKSRVLRRIAASGKTGTAQTGHFWSRDAWARKQAGERIQPDIRKPDHAWFAGFAPSAPTTGTGANGRKPKIAFVMLAEFSGLPGSDIADCVGEVVEAALARQVTPNAKAAQSKPEVRRKG